MMGKDLKHSEVVKKGGEATKAKYGRDHYVRMGKMGYSGKLKKYGKDYYRNLSKAGVAARKKKEKERKSGVNQLASILNGD